VLACKSSQDIFGTLVPRGPPVPLEQGAWLNPINAPVLRLSYHAEFGRSTVWASVERPQNLRALGPRSLMIGHVCPLETRPSTISQAVSAQLQRSSKNVWLFAFRLSRSLERTRIYRLPMTFC